VSSFVTVRGSIPLFWHQQDDWTQFKPSMVLELEGASTQALREHNAGPLRVHIDRLRTLYGRVLVLSLVDKAGPEAVIGSAFRDAFDHYLTSTEEQTDSFLEFEFHKHVGALAANGWDGGQASLQAVFGEQMDLAARCGVYLGADAGPNSDQCVISMQVSEESRVPRMCVCVCVCVAVSGMMHTWMRVVS
jgi:hypothetical protein